MANMQTHIREGRCPNIQEQQEEIWENIKTRNEGTERAKWGKRKEGQKRNLYSTGRLLWEDKERLGWKVDVRKIPI